MMALLLMVTEVMLGHSSKELTPKSVTLLGIVTEVRLLQPKKALLPMDDT